MIHPLVTQLRFARSEFGRVLEGVSAEEAMTRLEPMNCLSWMVGHLANQEQTYWLFLAQGKAHVLYPELNDLVGYGRPASTPPLGEMWAAWQAITQAADPYLDGLDTAVLTTFMSYKGQRRAESIGTMLYRNIYHYWFHIGEAHAIRQQLGHQPPDFVGILGEAAYRPE